MEHLLTIPQALIIMAVTLTIGYFVVTAKGDAPEAQIESDRELVEEQEDNYTNLAYLGRYGNCIQQHGVYHN